MDKIYDALTIAKWIINKVHPEPLKLQKLLYNNDKVKIIIINKYVYV